MSSYCTGISTTVKLPTPAFVSHITLINVVVYDSSMNAIN